MPVHVLAPAVRRTIAGSTKGATSMRLSGVGVGVGGAGVGVGVGVGGGPGGVGVGLGVGVNVGVGVGTGGAGVGVGGNDEQAATANKATAMMGANRNRRCVILSAGLTPGTARAERVSPRSLQRCPGAVISSPWPGPGHSSVPLRN